MTTAKHIKVQKEFDAFKKKVVEVAMGLAKEHEWCDVVYTALTEDLGLEVPQQKVRMVLEFEIDPDEEEDFGDLGDLSSAKDFLESLGSSWGGDRARLRDAVKSSEVFEAKD